MQVNAPISEKIKGEAPLWQVTNLQDLTVKSYLVVYLPVLLVVLATRKQHLMHGLTLLSTGFTWREVVKRPQSNTSTPDLDSGLKMSDVMGSGPGEAARVRVGLIRFVRHDNTSQSCGLIPSAAVTRLYECRSCMGEMGICKCRFYYEHSPCSCGVKMVVLLGFGAAVSFPCC
jgi:hypothetical protein